MLFIIFGSLVAAATAVQASALDAADLVKRLPIACLATETSTTTAVVPPPTNAVCADEYMGTFSTFQQPLTATSFTKGTQENFSSCRNLCLDNQSCQAFAYGSSTKIVASGTATCKLYTKLPGSSFKRKTQNNSPATYYYSTACFTSSCTPVLTSTRTPTVYATSIVTQTSTITTNCATTTTSAAPPPDGLICGSQGTPSNPVSVSSTTITGGSFNDCLSLGFSTGTDGKPFTGFGYHAEVTASTTTVTCSVFEKNFIFSRFKFDSEGAGHGTYYYNTGCFSSSVTCTPTSSETVTATSTETEVETEYVTISANS